MFTAIGHAPALEALRRALDSGRPAHAYLFVGPEGVGKETVAREFAAALNCTGPVLSGSDGSGVDSTSSINPYEKPCGECRACRDTLAARHVDVELVAPGGLCDEPEHKDHADSRDLRICQIRRLERVLSLAPYAGGRRVAIIDAADSLHVEAANAFLKTLEEPPGESVIILLAERQERLPETVVSRCQRIVFRPIERATLVAALLDRGADDAQAQAIAAAAGGRLGWALQALADPSLLAERTTTLDEAVRLAHGGRIERFAWAAAASSRAPEVRERYQRALNVWESWWRDVLLATAGGSAGFAAADRAALLAEEGRLYLASDIVAFLRSLLQTREHLYANVDPQLALENLMLDLPQPRLLAGRR